MRRKWQPTPVFLLEESHEQRSLVGHGPQGHRVGSEKQQLLVRSLCSSIPYFHTPSSILTCFFVGLSWVNKKTLEECSSMNWQLSTSRENERGRAGLQWNKLLKFVLDKSLHCFLHSFPFLVTAFLVLSENYSSHTALWTWLVFIWGHFSFSNVLNCKITPPAREYIYVLSLSTKHTFMCMDHTCMHILPISGSPLIHTGRMADFLKILFIFFF